MPVNYGRSRRINTYMQIWGPLLRHAQSEPAGSSLHANMDTRKVVGVALQGTR